MEEGLESVFSRLPMNPASAWNLLEASPASIQPEFQSYSNGADHGSTPLSADFEDLLLGLSSASFPRSRVASPPMLSPLSEDLRPADRGNDRGLQPVSLNMRPATAPGSASHGLDSDNSLPPHLERPTSISSSASTIGPPEAGLTHAPARNDRHQVLGESNVSKYMHERQPSFDTVSRSLPASVPVAHYLFVKYRITYANPVHCGRKTLQGLFRAKITWHVASDIRPKE